MAQPIPKRERFSKKVLLCVWWNFEGIIHFELIPNGVSVDANFHCVQLYLMFVNITAEVHFIVQVLLKQDNAKPYTAKKTVEEIKEFDSV